MSNPLFICGKTDFGGLSHDVDEKVSSEQIEWGDVIYVMEARQKKRLNALFGPWLAQKLAYLR
ncbi:MAG: hypothetical protein COB08_015785 [Rhodobacteraceae bacterium]|nr:hypothetical protein [Paracoccaceae bacterium]